MEVKTNRGLYVSPKFEVTSVEKDIITMSGDDPFISDKYDLGGNSL